MKGLKTILVICIMFMGCSAFAQQTTIWIVRHGEKAVTPANDPDLSAEGKARAIALADRLKDQKIAAVFTTPYNRTTQTGQPTLKQFGLTAMQEYETANMLGFAEQVLKEYHGREVLVIGHSNTIIPTLKAFGATATTDILDDEDYDLIFKLTIDKTGKITGLEIKNYGAPHHSNKAVPVNTMTQSN